jgi:hypothetical protein
VPAECIRGRATAFALIGSAPRALGYSFNLAGSMVYYTFGTLFIAQAYGVRLGLGQMIGMLLLLVTSKGMAGVPRARPWWLSMRRCRSSTCPWPASASFSALTT